MNERFRRFTEDPNPNKLQLIIDIDLPTGKVQVKNVSGKPIDMIFLASVFTKLADNNLDNALKAQSMLINPDKQRAPISGNDDMRHQPHPFVPFNTTSNPTCKQCGFDRDDKIMHPDKVLQ